MSALAIALVLLSALFHAIRSLFTKESDDKQVFLWLYSLFAFLHLFFGMCCYTPLIVLTKDAEMIRKEWHAGSIRVIMAGVIGITGYALILVAFTIDRVSYIVGLRQTSIVFAVLMGSHLLKEKHRGIRLAGALIIFSGGFLISLAR